MCNSIKVWLKGKDNIVTRWTQIFFPHFFFHSFKVHFYGVTINCYKLMFSLYSYYMRFRPFEVFIISLLLIWAVEWIVGIEYCFNYWDYSRVIFPYRIPKLLMVVFIYWNYIWGVSIWKRAQFGRFVRGDRKLWFKGFASFWVIEVSTVVGIFLCIFWMSWGPLPLLNRYFILPKKSFLVEITVLSYVIWIIYFLRLTLKWQLRKMQFFLVSIVIIFISFLLWRDILLLYTREAINLEYGSRWKYVKTNSLVYSLSNIWWLEHHIGTDKSLNTPFMSLDNFISLNGQENPFTSKLSLTEYEEYNLMSLNKDVDWFNSDFLFNIFKYNNISNDYHLIDQNGYYYFINSSAGSESANSLYFYPRKVGFLPKRLSMWYMLVVIKIWHHFMLFIWWFFYLLRLVARRKNSYSLLSVCSFNVFCCYLLSLLIYLFQLLPLYENFLRIKPEVRWAFFNKSLVWESIGYIANLCTFETGLGDLQIEFWMLVDYFYMLPRNKITDADMPGVFEVGGYTTEQLQWLYHQTIKSSRFYK